MVRGKGPEAEALRLLAEEERLLPLTRTGPEEFREDRVTSEGERVQLLAEYIHGWDIRGETGAADPGSAGVGIGRG